MPDGRAPAGGGAAWDGFPDPPGDADPVSALANEFRFQAVLALVKAARQDMLIATHLSLALAQNVLVLGMLLRDRESGTSYHRRGGDGWSRWAPTLSVALNPSRGELISTIQNLAVAFDRAAVSWGPIPAVAEEPLTGLLRAASDLP